jgi:hypothetical protein
MDDKRSVCKNSGAKQNLPTKNWFVCFVVISIQFLKRLFTSKKRLFLRSARFD